MHRGSSAVGFFVLFCFLACVAGAADARVRVGPKPAWLYETGEPEYTAETPSEGNRGTYFLLVDRQVQAEKAEEYSRVAYKVTSSEGVQGGAQISVSFDPEYEEIEFHHLRVWRSGSEENRLVEEKIQILQQERDLDRNMYNGQRTALVLLDDVRVGDVVDYAYTRRGRNPIFGSHFFDITVTAWGAPLRRFSYRVLVDSSRPFFSKTFGPASHVEEDVRARGTLIEHSWTAKDVAPLQFEEGAPAWYIQYPWIQIADFADWGEVVKWARPLYKPANPPSEILEKKVTELTASCRTDTQRAIAILDFVQNEIRYLGIELGPRSHAPSLPEEVFNRRFGDCKDKVRLLCAMLGHAGIRAVPALTHSSRRLEMKTYLPSPEVFDHVIARIDLLDATYWVDPTLTDQAGGLEHRALPNYGYALPIESTSSRLQEVDTPSISETGLSTREDYTFAEIGGPGTLEVLSTYTGLSADSMRAYLKRTPIDRVAKDFLNSRTKYYRKIEPLGAPSWREDRAKNEVVVTHRYSNVAVWEKSADSPQLHAEFYPYLLREYLAAPESLVRSAPFHLAYPSSYAIDTTVHVPIAWPLEPKQHNYNDPAFTGSANSSANGKTLTFSYRWKSKTDHVEASRMNEYADHLREFRDVLGYTLTYNPEIARRNAHFRINWFFIVVSVVALGAGAAAMVWLYRRPWGLYPESEYVDPGLQGIGGWLIVVAFGVILRPIAGVISWCKDMPKFFDARVWENVANSETRAVVLGESVFQIVFLTLGILSLVTFFQKRRIFPLTMVLVFAGAIFFRIVDSIMVAMLSKSATAGPETVGATLTQLVIPAAVWIPYLFVSRRVKSTFRARCRRRRRAEIVEVESSTA